MQLRRDFLRALEAALMGLFFVQSIRFLYTALYARVSSADLVRRVDIATLRGVPGVVEPAEVQREIVAVAAILLAPLLALLLVRTRWSIPLTVAIAVVGRSLSLQLPESAVLASAVVVAAGFLYMTLIAMRRPAFFPVMLVTGFLADQFIRAHNSTADPTFDPTYRFVIFGQLETNIRDAIAGVALFMLAWTALTTLIEREEMRLPRYKKRPAAVLSGWGALGLGGFLYLQFTALGLPNAVARWASVDYTLMLPLIMLATGLPLVPEVRAQAGRFLSIFDGVYRGWLWLLLLVLLLVIGKRFEGLAAGVTLTLAQFTAILALWWMVKVPEERVRVNPTPILMLLAALVFVGLTVGDYFTYDYAYVRENVAPPFDDLLRGMRDMGLPLALFAAVLTCMPMILERQTIPWREGKVTETLLTLLMLLAVTLSATRAAVPDPLRRPLDTDQLRVASLNLHSGYTQYFADNLELAAALIERSGADIVLLQEVDAGRLTSGSTDQALWLARRLDMNVTFFPQNEELQGLAVLSRLDVNDSDGLLLTSSGPQAGVQAVRYSLDESGDLYVYNVWLGYLFQSVDGQVIPESLQDQVRQFEELQRLIAANHFRQSETQTPPQRVILGGTFNFDESSPLYPRLAETVFRDPFTELFEEQRDTFFTIDGEAARWDYLWLLNLSYCGMSNVQRNLPNQTNVVSDHRLILVSVRRVANESCVQP